MATGKNNATSDTAYLDNDVAFDLFLSPQCFLFLACTPLRLVASIMQLLPKEKYFQQNKTSTDVL